MRYLTTALLASAMLAGCGGDSSENERLYIAGYMKSATGAPLTLDEDYNAFFTSTCDGESFRYQVAVITPGAGRFDPSEWSFVFNASDDLTGSVSTTEKSFHIYSGYVAEAVVDGNDCAIDDDFDDRYRAITGSVYFTSTQDAIFSLTFQKLDTDDNPVGASFNVDGCWRVSTSQEPCEAGAMAETATELQFSY